MKRMPILSVFLGICSPLPLLIMFCVIFFYKSSTSIPVLLLAFTGYAATLLSFIGGINWILSMNKPVILLEKDNKYIDNKRLLLAIIPCLIAEIAIVVSATHHISVSLMLLMVGFILTLFHERKSYLPTELPVGYLSIRWFTTIVIEFSLFGVLFARLIL